MIVAAVPPEYYAGDRDLYKAIVDSNRARVSPDGKISLEAATRTFRNLAAFGASILAVATGFVSILLVAFVYAWKKGVLDWKS